MAIGSRPLSIQGDTGNAWPSEITRHRLLKGRPRKPGQRAKIAQQILRLRCILFPE
jgi:hypothetical protein